MYEITKYSFDKAKKLGVTIKPSKNPLKKIDVYDKNGQFIVSIGSSKHLDYPYYIRNSGIDYANERRRLYRLRHTGEDKKKGTAGFYAWHLLW